jgi:hypothetical protein
MSIKILNKKQNNFCLIFVLDTKLQEKNLSKLKLPKGRVLGGLIHISTMLSTRQALKKQTKKLKNKKIFKKFYSFT